MLVGATDQYTNEYHKSLPAIGELLMEMHVLGLKNGIWGGQSGIIIPAFNSKPNSMLNNYLCFIVINKFGMNEY